MLDTVKTVEVYVSGQERSVDFYLNVLGFEVGRRMPMGAGRNGATARWLV